jgi:RNA polymerase sigma-70 factor (ECF subfamily)
MARLPYEQREVFVLRVQGQMKFRQIASVQGVSVNSAHSRYRYALDRLRSLLQEENHT